MSKSFKELNDKIIYLNTETNCTKVASGSKNVEFIWNIPSITIDEFAKLKVFCCQQGVGTRGNAPLSFRLKNVLFNLSTYYSSENSQFPLIFAGSFNTDTAFFDNDLAGITIIPQTINTISIVVSDVLTSQNAGIANTMGFLIGISIQQYDLKLSEINNPYR